MPHNIKIVIEQEEAEKDWSWSIGWDDAEGSHLYNGTSHAAAINLPEEPMVNVLHHLRTCSCNVEGR